MDQFYHQATPSNENFISAHNQVTYFPVRRDDYFIIVHRYNQGNSFTTTGGDPLKQQIKKKIGGYPISLIRCTVNIAVNQLLKIGIAHIGKGLRTHSAAPC